MENPASREGALLQRTCRQDRRIERRSLAVAALLVVLVGSVAFTARAASEPDEAESTDADGLAPEAEPDTAVASGGTAQATGAPTQQAIAQHDQQGEELLEQEPQVDYEQLARALEAIYSTKPICTMRIIEADPVDPGIELAIRRPIDPGMVREPNCR